MTRKTLIEQSQNPKGRRLLQDNDNVIYVLSECCDINITDTKVISVIRGGEHVEEEWAMCSRCHRTLERNVDGWTASPHIEYETHTDPKSWARWGKFWFGLDEFGMEIEA